MKILKYFLIFLGFLILGCAVLILLSPKEINYSNELEVELPVEDCWTVFHDTAVLVEWVPNLKSIRHFSGEPHTIGSVSELTYEENGREVVMLETTTAYEKNKTFGFSSEFDEYMRINSNIEFTPIDSVNTKIHSSTQVKALSFLMRMAMWGSKKHMEDRNNTGLQKFKKLAEEYGC